MGYQNSRSFFCFLNCLNNSYLGDVRKIKLPHFLNFLENVSILVGEIIKIKRYDRSIQARRQNFCSRGKS